MHLEGQITEIEAAVTDARVTRSRTRNRLVRERCRITVRMVSSGSYCISGCYARTRAGHARSREGGTGVALDVHDPNPLHSAPHQAPRRPSWRWRVCRRAVTVSCRSRASRARCRARDPTR
jgi:hypothetical protein